MEVLVKLLCRYEAAGLPSVVTSAIDPRRFDEARTSYCGSKASDIPQPQHWAIPARQWVLDMLNDFVAVRRDLTRYAASDVATILATAQPWFAVAP